MGKVTFGDFKKLDIRIGEVVEAEVPKWSHWVIKLTVKFDKEIGERTIFAGLLGFYKPEDLKQLQLPFIVNLEPKKIGPKGDYSEGMMLVIETKTAKPVVIDDKEVTEKPVLLTPQEKVKPGDRIS